MCRHLGSNSNPPLPLSIEHVHPRTSQPCRVPQRQGSPLPHARSSGGCQRAPCSAGGVLCFCTEARKNPSLCPVPATRVQHPGAIPPQSDTTPGPVAGAPCSPPESPGNAAAPHSTCKGIGAPRPPAPLPCDAAGTHRLICAGCLVLLKEKVPGAVTTLREPSPHPAPPASPCRWPPHLTSRTRETWLQPPETLGHCHSVTRIPPGQNHPASWPGWQRYAGKLAPSRQTHDLGIAEKLLPGVSGAGHGCRRGRRDHGGTPVTRYPWGWRGPGLHLPPPFL